MDNGIFKDTVIGWVVLKCKYNHQGQNGPECFLSVVPLTVNWEGILDYNNMDIEPDFDVVAVIPAISGTYQVWGEMQNRVCEVLGYEFPGAYYPDWQEIIKEKILKAGGRNG